MVNPAHRRNGTYTTVIGCNGDITQSSPNYRIDEGIPQKISSCGDAFELSPRVVLKSDASTSDFHGEMCKLFDITCFFVADRHLSVIQVWFSKTLQTSPLTKLDKMLLSELDSRIPERKVSTFPCPPKGCRLSHHLHPVYRIQDGFLHAPTTIPHYPSLTEIPSRVREPKYGQIRRGYQSREYCTGRRYCKGPSGGCYKLHYPEG